MVWEKISHTNRKSLMIEKGSVNMERSNHNLNYEIERFINQYDGTAIGQSVKNMYENGTSYESICEVIDIDYDEYAEYE